LPEPGERVARVSRAEVGPGRLVVAVVWLFTSYQLVTRCSAVVAGQADINVRLNGRRVSQVRPIAATSTSRMIHAKLGA
jgi:hypothetical protein